MGGYSDSDLSCERSYEELLKKFIENEVEKRVSNFKLQLSEQEIIKLKVQVENRDGQLENVCEELKLKEEEVHKQKELSKEEIFKMKIQIVERENQLGNVREELKLKEEELHQQKELSEEETFKMKIQIEERENQLGNVPEELKLKEEELQKKIAELDTWIPHYVNKIANMAEKLELANEQLKISKDEIAILRKELYKTLELQDQLKVTQENLAKLECEVVLGRNHIQMLENLVIKYEAIKTSHEFRVQKLNSEMLDLKAKFPLEKDEIHYDIASLSEMNLQLTSKLEKCESRNHELENKLRQYEVEKLKQEELHATQQMVLQDKISSLRELCQRKHVVAANKESDKLMIERDKVNAKIDKLNAKIFSKNDQISNLKIYKLKLEEMNLQLTSKFEKCESRNHELENKLRQYEVEKLKQKELHATPKMVLQDEISSLREELCRRKHDVVAANKESDKLMIERDKVNAKIDKLNAKIFSKNDQISNLKRNKLKPELGPKEQLEVNKWKLRVEELEQEVTRQNGVISDMAEEKKEAIRQQCFSLEYYRSRYVKLRQAFRRLRFSH